MKRIIFILIYSAFTLSVLAQGDDNSLKGVPLKERIVTGGGFGMSFGSMQDFISVSPMLGFKFTQKFMGGTSVTYRYTKYKYISPAVKLTDYGINPFLRYTIMDNIFIQTEFEYLNYEYPLADGSSYRKTFNGVFAGGGFMQPVGDKGVFYVMALYNLTYTDPKPGEYSPYYTPLVLRAGFNIGF